MWQEDITRVGQEAKTQDSWGLLQAVKVEHAGSGCYERAPSNPCSLVPSPDHMHPQPFPEAKGQKGSLCPHLRVGKFPLYTTVFRYRTAAKTSGTASTFSLNPRASPHQNSQLLPKREASSSNQLFHWSEQVQ